MERWPDFLIIGAMKAGTSSLYKNLIDHPEVDRARTKEIGYFTKHFERGAAWYGSQFPAGSGAITGEATVSYMYDRTAVDRMAELVPHARLIAILRNPVDRAWSHYRMRRSRGIEHRGPAEAFTGARSTSDESVAEFDGYLRRGQYIEQLEHVVTRYPRQQLLVLLFDDMIHDPAALYDSTCTFLGISTAVRPPYLETVVNAHAEYRSIAVRKLLQMHGPGWSRKAVGRLNVKHPPPDSLAPDLRAELVEHFRPFNRRLAVWLDRDLSHWDR